MNLKKVLLGLPEDPVVMQADSWILDFSSPVFDTSCEECPVKL